MTEATDTPWLHLPLDESYGATLRDRSGSRRNAATSGELSIVDDQQRGACLELRGGSVTLPIMDPPVFAAGFTLMFWARHGADGALCAFGVDGNRLALRSTTPEAGVGEVVAVLEGLDLPRVEHRVSSADEWFFFALALTPDGVVRILAPDPQDHPLAESPGVWRLLFGSAAADGPRRLVLGGAEYRGRLAQLRIFARALDRDEVLALRTLDAAAGWRLEGALPVAISLEDSDASPVLTIDPRAGGQAMTLRVSNRSRAPIHLALQTGEPNADNAHFVLSFRPGTLTRLADVRVGGEGWRLAASPAGSEPGHPEDRLFLLATGTPSLPVEIELQGLYPDARDGTRTTRIELAYQHLRSAAAEEALRGVRSQQLSLINHRGRRPVPVHVACVGPARAVIDRVGELRVHIRNYMPDDGETLQFDDRACVQIAFDEARGAAWALASPEVIKRFSVVYDRTAVREGSPVGVLAEPDETRASRWTLPLAPLGHLAPREWIEVVIAGVIAEGSPGPTHIYVDLVNVPGSWDNRFACVIDKVEATAAGSPWQPLAVNGWISGPEERPEARRDASGVVHLRGRCTRTAALGEPWSEVAISLSAEFRPERPLTLQGPARTRLLADPEGRVLQTWCGVVLGDPASRQPPAMIVVDPIGQGGDTRFADFLGRRAGLGEGAHFEVCLSLDGVSYVAADAPPERNPDPDPPAEPAPEPNPPQREGPEGSLEGEAFDDGDAALAIGRPISRVEIRAGNIVDGLRVWLGDEALPWHGGDGGALDGFSLEPDDVLVGVSGFVGTWSGHDYVVQLTFITRGGREYGHYGDMTDASDLRPFSFAAGAGRHIAAFFGAALVPEGIDRPYLAGIGVLIADLQGVG